MLNLVSQEELLTWREERTSGQPQRPEGGEGGQADAGAPADATSRTLGWAGNKINSEITTDNICLLKGGGASAYYL